MKPRASRHSSLASLLSSLVTRHSSIASLLSSLVTRHLSLVIAAAMVSATAAARTVNVASVTDTSASLAFGGADGAAYTLAWGYGATDGGSATNAWDTFESLGTVAAGDTSRTVALPNGWGSTATRLRFFLIETQPPATPYARRLEYIASSGSQWIDTGIEGKVGITAEIDFACTADADATILGSRSGNDRFFPVHWNWKKIVRTLGSWDGTKSTSATVGTRYLARATLKSGEQSLHVDGTAISAAAGTASSSLDTSLNMYLFAANIDGSASQKISARIYSAKIWNGDTLVRSFVPCEDGNGEACLWDFVSKQYFRNAESGSFSKGGEVAAAPRVMAVSAPLAASAAFGRSVSVSSVDDSHATLSFGAPDGNAYTLARGFGVSDGGADTNAWDSFEILGTVAADATAQTVALPAGWGSTVLRMRFFLLAPETRPYAKRLEYIQSSGSQWIDTGVRGRVGVAAELDIEPVTMADHDVLGSRTDSGDTRFYLVHWNSNDLLGGIGGGNYGVKKGYWYWTGRSSTIPAGMRRLVRSVCENGNQSVAVDGTEIAAATYRSAFDSGNSMYLFACHNGSSASYACSAKLRSAKIWEGDTLVRDFVPCEDVGGEACLYDLVSDGYFRAGSGTFAAGGEIAAQTLVAAVSSRVDAPVGNDGAADTVLWDDDTLPAGEALVKVGSNRAIVQTAEAVDGDIDVRGGSLVFSGRTCTNEWYRFLFNGSQYNDYYQIAIGDLKVFSDTTGTENVALGIGADGGVLDAGTSAANLARGQCVAHFATTDVVPEGVYANLSDLSNAFDGTTANAVLSADTYYIYNNGRQTWVAFRMAEGNNRVQSYLPVKSNFTWYWHPSAWLFQTSADGINWQTVDKQTGAISSSGYGSTPFVVKGFLADGAAGFDPSANVKVASGATLDASGVAGGQSLEHLTVDWAAGAGTITGVTIAQNGVLDLVNVPANTRIAGKTIPVTLSGLSGTANFGTWTIRVNGTATTERLYWNGSSLRIPGAVVISIW